MKLRLTNLLLLTFLAMNCFSQNTSTVISGKIVSYNNSVHNVHIINLNNKRGTISDDLGNFEIKVKINDTLLVSAIQYKNLKIVISKSHFSSRKIKIYLIPSVTILDEVFLHGLTGDLYSDIHATPIDTLPKHNFVYKLSDLYKKLPGDEYGYLNSVNAESFTNPLYIRGGGQGSKYDKRLEAKRKLKRQFAKKKQFPIKIKKDLGIDFFTNNLKIPEGKINHFLAYCEYKNIIELYYKNNLLEVIKILQEESKSYHEIQNNK